MGGRTSVQFVREGEKERSEAVKKRRDLPYSKSSGAKPERARRRGSSEP